MMKTILTVFLTILITLASSSQIQAASPITLSSNGATEYAILIPENPTPVQQTAANELQFYLREMTGAEFPIVKEDPKRGGRINSFDDAKLLIIGPSATSRRALADDSEATIAKDGIILRNVGSSIVLSGAPERGPLYAVYEFLEAKLGCRWWTATEATIPRAPNGTLVIDPTLDVDYAPKIQTREPYYLGAFDPIFAARSRCNGDRAPIAPEFGGHNTFVFGCHSAFALIPPLTYFIEHPDWFAEIDGVRKVCLPGNYSQEYKEFKAKLQPEQIAEKGTQLCWSNDAMIEELVKNARAELRAHPDAAFIDVSQEDWDGWCSCEKCKALDEENGSHAGSLLYCVNKVAEALEEEFPNVLVETLAYKYTRQPTKVIKPRKNVLIRLCSIECSFAHPIDSEINASFRDDLLGWSKIADNLFVWDYVTDFGTYMLPFPNGRVLAPNLRFFVDHNVVGVMEQGDYHSPTGDFVELRNWVLSKLLWNPELDPNALRDEFVAGYYAPELVPIYRDYFNVLLDAVERANCQLSIYKMDVRDWMTRQTLNQATKLQNEALAIARKLEAKDPEAHKGLVDKVRKGRMPIEYVWLQEYPRYKYESELFNLEFCGPDDPAQAARDYVAKLEEFGITRHREACWPEFYEKFKKDLVKDYE